MRDRLVEHGAHLRHGELRGRRHHRAEVHLRVAKGEIAVPVGHVGAHEREVALDGLLEHVLATIEAAHLLAARQLGAETDGRIESRDAGAAGADALGKGALRHAFELDLAVHPKALEGRGLLGLAPRGRAHHLAHEAGLDQLMRVASSDGWPS